MGIHGTSITKKNVCPDPVWKPVSYSTASSGSVIRNGISPVVIIR